MYQTKVKLQDVFSIEDCNANPNNLYIFGDNLLRKGRGGQAIIRYCKNTFGVITKRLPSMNYDAFLRDTQVDYDRVKDDVIKLKDIYNSGIYEYVVFPTSGLGTGLAKLYETAPRIFGALSYQLSHDYGIFLTQQGFKLNSEMIGTLEKGHTNGI